MPSRKMRTAIYLFYGLDVEIRPIWTPPELFIHLGGAIGIRRHPCGAKVLKSMFAILPQWSLEVFLLTL